MSTETVTVVSLDPESSRDGTKHWWILTDASGRKLKIWEPPIADAVRSLAALGPVVVDVRESSDPKYLDAVTAARSANGGTPAPVDTAPANLKETKETVLADFMRDLSDAARRAEVRLRDLGVPF